MHRKPKKRLGSLVPTSLPEEYKTQPVNNNSGNIKISRSTKNATSNLENDGPVINGKNPSKDLLSQIEEFGYSFGDLKNLNQKIREKGIEEGFSDLEINLLAREIFRNRLSTRQLNYWFPLKRNWKKRKNLLVVIHNL